MSPVLYISLQFATQNALLIRKPYDKSIFIVKSSLDVCCTAPFMFILFLNVVLILQKDEKSRKVDFKYILS